MLYIILPLLFALFLTAHFICLHAWMLRVLRKKGAVPVGQHPTWANLQKLLERITWEMRLPLPALYLVPEYVPNSFGLRFPGRKSSVLVITEGLAHILTATEMEEVLRYTLLQIRRQRTSRSFYLAVLGVPLFQIVSSLPKSVSIILRPCFLLLGQTLAGTRGKLFEVDTYVAHNTDRRSRYSLAAAMQKMTALAQKTAFKENWSPFEHLFILSNISSESFFPLLSKGLQFEERLGLLLQD